MCGYILVIRDVINCLAKETVYAMDKKTVKKPVLEKKKVIDRVFFRPCSLPQTCVVGHIDLVESLLRREIKGISLEEIELVE